MTISSAIHDRHLLSFTYDGFPRVVEPHCYGTDKKGHPALRAYQVQGGSEALGFGANQRLNGGHSTAMSHHGNPAPESAPTG